MTDIHEASQIFLAELQTKIAKLLEDFSEGKLNKEQFNTIYARYNNQIRVLEDAILQGNNNPVAALKDNEHTTALMKERAAKVHGLRIFDVRTTMPIDTFGEFDLPLNWVMPYVNNMMMMMEARQPLAKLVEKFDEKRFVMFASGRYTVAVIVFQNEPSPRQVQEVGRLHRDFEDANRNFFQSGTFDVSQLASPFIVLISQKKRTQN